MPDLLWNFAYGRLVQDIDAAATSVVVDDATSFPTTGELQSGVLYLSFSSALARPNSFEIVRLLAVDHASNTLTIARAAESTVAASHPVGTYLRATVTAAMLARIRSGDTGDTLPSGEAYRAGDRFLLQTNGASSPYFWDGSQWQPFLSSGGSGQPRFTGEGPPSTVVGAIPGDEYLDNLTGDIYRLS